jgi:hypothetical protein
LNRGDLDQPAKRAASEGPRGNAEFVAAQQLLIRIMANIDQDHGRTRITSGLVPLEEKAYASRSDRSVAAARAGRVPVLQQQQSVAAGEQHHGRYTVTLI